MKTGSVARVGRLGLARFGGTLVTSCVLLWSAPAPGQQEESGPRQTSRAYTVQSNVQVALRDGTNMAVDIYRPREAGEYPTLYAAGPFPHNGDDTAPDNARTGPVAWYASQGYAVVLASSRGTGQSQGEYGFLSRDEQQDHYELIEWIAEQDWSNEQVAGYGAGYYATSQWLAAVQNPPHLACIAPFNGVLDIYRDWAYPGGVADRDFAFDWYDRQVRMANAYPVSGPGTQVEFDLRLEQLRHPLYDEFWRLRSALENLDRIDVPVFLMRNLAPGEPGADGTFRALDGLGNLNKLLLAGPDQSFASIGFHQREVLPFYRWCLENEDTEFIERPRVRYFVSALGRYKPDSTWPPGNISQTPLYLQPSSASGGENTGSLIFDGPPEGRDTSVYGQDAANVSLRFVSAPLARDVELSGPLMMELFLASSATDAGVSITLSEQVVRRQIEQNNALPSFLNPDSGADMNVLAANTLNPVSTGHLKLSLRATDPAGSSEYRPRYAFTRPRPLVPGQIYRLEIALRPTVHRFQAGNRIVVEIQQVLDGSLAGLDGSETVWHTGRYPSRLWLPMVQSPSDAPVLSDNGAGAPAGAAEGSSGTTEDDARGLFDSDSPVISIPPEDNQGGNGRD